MAVREMAKILALNCGGGTVVRKRPTKADLDYSFSGHCATVDLVVPSAPGKVSSFKLIFGALWCGGGLM